MSAMESETFRAPLFQAHMLSQGQKRKHSNGSIGLLSSPPNSRIALKAPDTAQPPAPQRYTQEESLGRTSLVEETERKDGLYPCIRLGGDLSGQVSQNRSSQGIEGGTEPGKQVESYTGTIPFPSRTGQITALETSLSGDKTRKFPDPNNPPEIAVAVQPRKDPAPRFFGDAIADFYPWKGDDVEDKLTEQVIKTGLTDRFHVSGECNSANTTLGLHLKQPTTLQNLSTLLVTAMHMRQENSRVTANSTFKPPPRVTLTDTRREAWLRDLADEAIPLRRLSRTIPHGIRGRILLDHCLEKRIPVKRAVWLAQCVGANEIRAFKRKGISGAITTSNERKWVQEWTTTLEFFLETILQTCDKPESEGQLNYATDLTRHLYSEQLVDREHLLTWSLSTIEQTKISRLPLCLVILRIFWKDLILSFRFGSRLIAVLIKDLFMLKKHQNEAEVSRLITHIQHFLADVVRLQPLSALIPWQWQSLRPCLLEILKNTTAGPALSESRMLERTDRLCSISHGVSCDTPDPKQRCFKVLDDRMAKRRSLINVEKLTQSCLDMFGRYENFILALMHWASSVFRVGHQRIHLATRIIGDLSKRQHDTSGAILQCLSSLKTVSGISASSVTQLLTELYRAKTFDAGRYLRWLIATGALNGCSEQEFSVRCDLRFLIEMPSSELSSNVAGMRSMLLRKSRIVPNDNRALAMGVINQIKHYLTSETDEPLSIVNLDVMRQQNIDFVTGGVIVKWILRTCIGSESNRSASSPTKEREKITLRRDGLCYVLDILGYLLRHDALGEVISFFADHSDMEMLAPLTEALIINREELNTLGVLHSLWFKLLGRYYHLRSNASPEKHVASALERIASDLSPPTQVMDYLKQEVAAAGQHTVSIVYTPASEGTMDTAENSVTDSEEEIERMLGATTNLDPKSMRRIFLMLVKRLISNLDESTMARCSRFCVLLSKLRTLGSEEYSRLLHEFLDELQARMETSKKLYIFKILVGGDVCTFADIAKHMQTATDQTGLTFDFLDFLLDPTEGIASMEPKLWYNFLVQRITYIESHRVELVDKIIHATAMADPGKPEMEDRFEKLIQNCEVGDLCKHSLLTDSKRFAEKLEIFFREKGKGGEELLLKLLSQLMGHHEVARGHGRNTGSPLAQNFPLKMIFESVDELSFPFWRLITSLRLQALSASPTRLNEWKDEAVEAAKAAHTKQDSFWTCLLSEIGDIAARDIFLFVANTMLAPAKLGDLVLNDPQSSHKRLACFEILRSTAFAVRETSQPEVALKTVTTLSSLYAHWGDRDPDMSSEELSEDRKAFTSYLQIVLNLALILHNTIRKSTYCSDLLQILCRFLATDISIYDSDIAEFICDVAAFFTNFVDSSALWSVHESLPESVKRHEAVQFLLGTSLGGDAWLHVAHKLPSHQHATSSTPGNSEQIYASTIPFPLRSWELLPDAAPAVGPNDTALSLRLFDAKKLS